jgi:hypothetical protein
MGRVTRTQHVFRREGDYWTIAFDGKVVRLRDARGLRYLATLLLHPGEPLPVQTLVAAAGARTSAAARMKRQVGLSVAVADAPTAEPLALETERARVTVTKGIKSALERLAAEHPSLARHLSVTVKRGYVCTYNPDPRAPINWRQ